MLENLWNARTDPNVTERYWGGYTHRVGLATSG